jgi:murein DD-endopeptidase MepM/ murein hydrolase activator NlpD
VKKINFFLILLILSVALITIPNQALKAQQVSSQGTKITNPWREASFPLDVKNFQGYSSLFGDRRSPVTGKIEFHNGLDLAAPIGTYVYNWWTGKILELSAQTNCGTSVIIQSGDWKHIYCHLSGEVETSAEGTYLLDRAGGILLWQGQSVKTGTIIGRVGMTGRTTGPHLHWGLMYGGQYVDPGAVLRQMYQASSF